MATDLRSDPDYSEGFYDAADFAPLFPDASAPYEAGWRAYWRCRDLLDAAGFEARSSLNFSKTTVANHPDTGK
jgi:hypothetical protein